MNNSKIDKFVIGDFYYCDKTILRLVFINYHGGRYNDSTTFTFYRITYDNYWDVDLTLVKDNLEKFKPVEKEVDKLLNLLYS